MNSALTNEQRWTPWNSEGIGFGGVYRLYIGGQLVAEYVPSNYWTAALKAAESAHENVTYTWRAFEA